MITIAHEKTKEEVDKMKNLDWDDESIEKHVKNNVISEYCSKCIREEIKDRENFNVGDVDITYTNKLEIDLGGLTCILNAVGGTHTEDSAAIYVPEEKVMFMGDCIYGRRFNGNYGYNSEKILSMINEIEKNIADYYVVSYETICDRKEIVDFWELVQSTAQITGKGTSSEEAIKRFIDKFNREPSEEEEFFVNGFINANKV